MMPRAGESRLEDVVAVVVGFVVLDFFTGR